MKFQSTIFLIFLMLSCKEKKINSSEEFTTHWEFKNQKESSWLPANVPGEVHLDLLTNQLIDDPYRNSNELEQLWIENENWEYRSKWKVNSNLLKNDHVELEFKGLDTYAKIYLNDSMILATENMFRTYKVDVKPILVDGINDLRIEFSSPLNYNRERVTNYPLRLPSGNETGSLQVSAFTRKAAYQFGWDWGPRFVSMGIWRPILVNAWNDYRLEDVFVTTKSIEDDFALIEVSVTIQSDATSSVMIEVGDKRFPISLTSGRNEFQFPLKVENPKLWWPNGFGDQELSTMGVKLFNESTIIDKKEIRYGIRTVELINEPDSIGTSYYFKINGVPIFMKGANYIPQDVFPSRVLKDQYLSLIRKVKEGNMNMLRVWGGGIYEDDLFYDLCDENGILVWQDFMFAGSMYPVDSSFHNNVIQEVKDNVVRLRSHPSIVLWCGNNEIEVAWKNWGWIKQFDYSESDSTTLWENYIKLFHEEIPAVVASLSPYTDYVTTSPLSNWGTPENFNHNSMHYWGVWHGREPLENFETNIGRFMSEYGFQSFPSFQTMASVIDSTQLKMDSEIMSNRQKSYIGNEMITTVAEKHFGESANFEEYILDSQKAQSLALELAIKAHRLNKPHCMGTLFWQLNDVWQGPSWSVLEYNGTPKLAYETVKKWYQPIIVIPKHRDDSIDFYIVSDRMEKALLSFELNSQNGEISRELEVESNEKKKVLTIKKSNFQLRLFENGNRIFQDQLEIKNN